MLADTLAALASPRRAVPLALVLIALLFTEWLATRSLASLAIDGSLFLAFVLFVPAAWRLTRPVRLGTVVYGALCLGLVTLLAIVVPALIGVRGTYVLDPSAIGVVLVLVLVGGWGLGRDIELEAGWESERLRAARLEVEAARAQVLALRAQLDPHFLFNTLNAIAEHCREDPVVAESATLRLASLLRAMLEGVRAPAWPLASELALVRGLFELHAIRDASRYRFALDLPDVISDDAQVPPMLLLPLAENAITHGPASGHDGEVRLRLRAEGGGMVLDIENPGAFGGRREGGEGIAMVERRLALAYGGAATLALRSEAGSTKATLRLPLRPSESEVLP